MFFLMIQLTPRATLFPYTTLFRSYRRRAVVATQHAGDPTRIAACAPAPRPPATSSRPPRDRCHGSRRPVTIRSEEHTSELQSRQYVVCRLLLVINNIRSQLICTHC